MLNVSLNVLLFHHFNIDQDVQQSYRYHGKKTKTKRNKNKTFFNYGDSSQCPFFFLLNLYYIHIILFMAPELERKNNTSCKTCSVINLEIKIIQFPLTPVPISPCIFPCTVLFVESASSHRSARSLETLVFLAAICRPG